LVAGAPPILPLMVRFFDVDENNDKRPGIDSQMVLYLRNNSTLRDLQGELSRDYNAA